MGWANELTGEGGFDDFPQANITRRSRKPLSAWEQAPCGDEVNWVKSHPKGSSLPYFVFKAEENQEGGEDAMSANVQRAGTHQLESVLLEGKQISLGETAVKPPIPNIEEGLGKQRAKEDLVRLEEFVSRALHIRILGGGLCIYEPPCWRNLDNRTAEMKIRTCLRQHGLAETLTERECSEIRKLLLINQQIQLDHPFATKEFLLNLRDGTLDVLSGHLLPHRPEDGFFSYLDVSYRDILASSGDGRYFEEFAARAAQWHPSVRTQLLEVVAFAISGIQAKKFFVLVGPTGTGKTQFGRFLRELVGKDHVMNVQDIDDFGKQFTCGSLAGKKLAMCLDLKDEPIPAPAIGVIKQMVGDDAVKGEKKFKDAFTFDVKPLLIFAGNHRVRIPHASKECALIERLVLVPLMGQVDDGEKVMKLYEKFIEEAPYIVAQALLVLRECIERNLIVTQAPIPKEYQLEEGHSGLKEVQQFVVQDCVVDEMAEVTTATLYERYCEDAHKSRLSETDFSRLVSEVVQELGAGICPIKRVRGTEKRGYRGLCLKRENTATPVILP